MFIMHKQWWLCIIHLQKWGSFNCYQKCSLFSAITIYSLSIKRVLSLFSEKHWWMTLNDIGLNDGTLMGCFTGKWLHLKIKNKNKILYDCAWKIRIIKYKYFFFVFFWEFRIRPVENHSVRVVSTCPSRFSEVTAVLHLIWWCVKQNTAHMFALN